MKNQLQNKLKNKPKNKLGNKLQNEKGSALAYVLIFGVVIMILVLGLLSVSKSGIAFTQESVESRQAYIDAKSVIEFGKIEISERVTALEQAEKKLNTLNAEYKNLVESEASQTSINQKISQINTAEKQRNDRIRELKAPFSIFADPTRLFETLSKSTGVEEVGELKVESSDDTQFNFTIATKNLRRTLDYQVSFSHQGASKKEDPDAPVKPERPEAPDKPIRPEDNPYLGEWNKGVINRDNNYTHVYAKFEGLKEDFEENKELIVDKPSNSLEITGNYQWINGKMLNMTASNIKISNSFPTNCEPNNSHFYFTANGKKLSETGGVEEPGEIRINELYNQTNQGLNTMTADNIIFEKGLVLDYKSQLDIVCKNLFINGNGLQSSSNSTINITADNIVITGNVNLGSGTNITINSKNTWIDGGIEVGENAVCTVKTDDTTADNIVMGGNLTIKKGAEMPIDCKNIWIDGKTAILSVALPTHFSNINYFSSGDVELQSGNELKLFCSASSLVEMENLELKSEGASLEIGEVNYLKIGDISLGQKNQLTIKGATGKKDNQLITGSIQPNTGNKFALKFTDLATFMCENLEINDNSTLELESDCVKINGELSLERMGNPAKITTQNLDVYGLTRIMDMNKTEFSVNPVVGKPLNVRFKGGYEQKVSPVFINQADMVVFSGNSFVVNDSQNKKLTIQAKDIYLLNKGILDPKHNDIDGFIYMGKKSNETNLHIEKAIDWKGNKTIKAGTYKEVSGDFPEVDSKSRKIYLYDLEPINYNSPVFPGCPGGDSGGGSIIIAEGFIMLNPESELYY